MHSLLSFVNVFFYNFQIVKLNSVTYRNLIKAVALVLITGLLLPSASQAKHLFDFCMKDMTSHHQMMHDSHGCCFTNEASHHSDATAKNHDCDDAKICECPLDETSGKREATVPSTASSAIILSQTGYNFMVTSPDEIIYEDFYALARQDSPPLYLLNDTFLN